MRRSDALATLVAAVLVSTKVVLLLLLLANVPVFYYLFICVSTHTALRAVGLLPVVTIYTTLLKQLVVVMMLFAEDSTHG